MNIKKISLFLLANVVGISLMAEGYQLNTQSARQIGMAHMGTALKLGAESMVFNPAGLSFMRGSADLSFGMTGISSKVVFTQGEYEAKTDNPLGTPIFGYAGFRLSEKFFAGVSISNPAGNSLVWPDNWRGTHFVQDISLQAFSIQPTISFKINDQWSIGAGFMANFGSFELNRGLIPVGGLAPFLQSPLLPQAYKDIISGTIGISPLNANLQGDSKITYGFNVGIMFTPNDQWSFGLSYRSKVVMTLEEGNATVSAATESLQSIFPVLATASPDITKALALDGQNFTAELPIPSNLHLGAAYKPNDKWLVSAELQYVGWSAYDTLSIAFPHATIHQEKNFSNSMIYRVGGEYYASEKFTLRAGFIYDSTPVDKTLYSPETPGANKPSLTAGLTFAPSQKFALDLGLQYLNGQKTRGSMPQASPLPAFEGEYKSTALLPSLGLRFNF
ncbi:MAG: outer membrane protein transport protein [Bacteroidales bacterium]|nr:outer membrane protein transport protein [Bacteroidales bacterium]MDD3844350.1 outer membrane protein transport protein [Bacteroidales bacterium]